MTRRKTATLLALLISCALPLSEKGKANAGSDSEVSKPSTAPEYSEMVQVFADRANRNTFAPLVADSTGEIVHHRAPTAAEIEKMGPLWPKVPPEKNAAYYFGKAILEQADYKEAPAGSAISREPYGGDIEALAKWVERNRPVLEAMREGLKQDFCCVPFGIVDEVGTPEPLLMFFAELRQIERDLRDAGFVEEVKGNTDRAASYYLECVRLGKKFHNATVIECLVGVSLQGHSQTALDNLVANATLGDKTLRGIIVACREAEMAQDAPARILASQSAFTEARVALAKAPWRDDPTMLLDLRSAKAWKDFVARKRLDELLQKKAMEAACEHELKEYAGKENTAAVLPRTFVEYGNLNVRLRVTQIRAAIALYQKANGRLPDSLDALCPDILPFVPIDPFSGKPMRYAKTPDGWKIWSVGADNVDNGGEAVTYPKNSYAVIFNEIFTSQVQSNIEHRSKGAIKSLPAPAETPKDPAAAGR
jgi:hypothetical protein